MVLLDLPSGEGQAAAKNQRKRF